MVTNEGKATPLSRAPNDRHPRTHNTARVHDEPAIVLHAAAYRETSLIVHAFTRQHGRVALIAKGAKRPNSQLRQALTSLQPLLVNWTGRSEVKTLTAAHWVGGQPLLKESGLLCGFYLSELMLKLTAREDPHEALFDAFVESLAALSTGERQEVVLRRFEYVLLREIGLGIELGACADGSPVMIDAQYVCIPEFGVRVARSGDAPDIPQLSGKHLLEIERGEFDDPLTLAQAKPLMRSLLNHALAGRTLATRQILIDLHAL